MQHYINKPGILFDSLMFLSKYCEDNSPYDENPKYHLIISKLRENSVDISKSLSLLTAPYNKKPSFLYTVLFDEWEYSICSISKLTQVIKNVSYMKNRFIEFYLPDLQHSDMRKISDMVYPDAINLITESTLLQDHKTYFIHSVINFESILQDLLRIINFIHKEITALHEQFIMQNQTIFKKLENGNDIDRLFTISHAKNMRGDFHYSLSLLDIGRISFRLEEPALFILGSEFDKILETRYKYSHLTPISFAASLGNEAKRSIFDALSKRFVMSTADMEKDLHLSRNAVSRNIKEMRDCGIVLIDHTEGLSYFYKLSKEYIDTVSELMKRICVTDVKRER